jgi:hypothetical protein
MATPYTPIGFATFRVWALPLIAGLLPAAAAAAALWISLAQETIAACNPFIDGCVSISRAGRHGLANHVFRALIVPGAALQGLTWLLCVAWLGNVGATGRSLRWLPWLGVLAGVFLVLYGTFLGSEGDAYRWMRRYGVVVYFGFTFLCMLITGGHLRSLALGRRMRIPARLDLVLLGLLVLTLLMGLANVFVPPFFGDDDLKNRLENVLEWYAASSYTIFFIVLAWLWRHTAFRASLRTKV